MNKKNQITKKRNKIIIGITTAVIIICIAAATIMISQISKAKMAEFESYACGNAFVQYSQVVSNINDCYKQSGDEQSAVSDGLQLYYKDGNHQAYQWSDIEFNAEHTNVIHAVLTNDATKAAENGFISGRFKGTKYRVIIDIPQEVYENKGFEDIRQVDANFTFEKLN